MMQEEKQTLLGWSSQAEVEAEELIGGKQGRRTTTTTTTTTTTKRRSLRTTLAGCLVVTAILASFVVVVTKGLCNHHGMMHRGAAADHHPHHHEIAQIDDKKGPEDVILSLSGFDKIHVISLPKHDHVADDVASGTELLRRRQQKHGLGMAAKRQSASTSSFTTSVTATSTAASESATGTVLVDFEVHQPVLTPKGATLDSGESNGEAGEIKDSCEVILMDYVFAYSYGEPYIGNYTPPDCEFNRVTINFTVVSEGRQYDRLALVYFNDTEIWRTSTAEPTTAPGISWTYLKDMTEFLSLWREPQKLIFDLGNLITDVYTGDYNSTLTATFFYDESVDVATAPPADLIIPISARKSADDGVSQFTLPADNATNTIAFPRNARRAVFSVAANGQSNEEFWWSNVLESDVSAFEATAGTFPGYSPWREVQVYIDGQLAGVDWPFPVVFTGGVVPSLHRPVVGPDAFDLKEHEIDITPWLGLLSDGNNHTFTIYVAGLLDNGGSEATVTQTVGSSWYVTGKIFVWLGEEDSVTTGSVPTVLAPSPEITVSQSITTSSNGTVNETLTYDVAVSRSFTVSASISPASNDSSSANTTVTWTQSLSYSNEGYIWAEGYSQINDFLTHGDDAAGTTAASVAGADYHYQYEWPLWCNTSISYSTEGNLTLYARLIQGEEIYVAGAAVYPDGLEAFAIDGKSFTGSLSNTTKDGTAWYFEYADDTVSSGYGSTDQVFSFGGFTDANGGSLDATPQEQLYYRHVEAANSTITLDIQELVSEDVATNVDASSAMSAKVAYAQVPLNGGNGAPRIFMNRQAQ